MQPRMVGRSPNYAFERSESTCCQARPSLRLAVFATGAPCGAVAGRST
jgi:hypothetical protein